MATKQVVFVLGGHLDPQYPWMFFHLDPQADPKSEPVDVAFFDYQAGKLKAWKNIVLKRGKAPAQAPYSETELTPKVKIRLVDGTTDDAGPDRASVLALYEWVKKQPPESIRSLQVFSHGWQGGPILWFSYEFDPDGNHLFWSDGKDRDPNDTDFRFRDFVGSNPLAGDEGTKFAKAFTSDALIKLWGCVAPEGVRGQMQRYISAPKGSSGDATRRAHLQDYLDAIGNSFPMEMAMRLILSVWASPLGYGSDPGTSVPTNRGSDLKVKYSGNFPPDLNKEQWWRVSWFFRNQDRGVTFYKDVLKARIDKTDYVEFTRDWFATALSDATASLAPDLIPSPKSLQQRLLDRIEQLGST